MRAQTDHDLVGGGAALRPLGFAPPQVDLRCEFAESELAEF